MFFTVLFSETFLGTLSEPWSAVAGMNTSLRNLAFSPVETVSAFPVNRIVVAW